MVAGVVELVSPVQAELAAEAEAASLLLVAPSLPAQLVVQRSSPVLLVALP